MAGFWFVQSEESAKRATNWAGSAVILGSVLLGFALWDNPNKLAMLFPLSLFYVGWKIRSAHARGWALLSALVAAGLALVCSLVPDIPNRAFFASLSWAIFALMVYGWVGARAYRRIVATNPYGRSHSDVTHQTKASMSAGLGACCCLLLIPGFASFSSKFGLEEVTTAVFMTVFVLAFLDPLLEYLSRTFGIREVTLGREKIKVQLGLIGISFLTVLLHSWLEQGTLHIGYSVPALLLMLLLVPGQITSAWIDGASEDRSAWLGLSRGFMLGLVSVWVMYLFLADGDHPPQLFSVLHFLFNPVSAGIGQAAPPSPPGLEPSPKWILWAFANASNWGVLGLVGGWARDRGWRAKGILFTLIGSVLLEGGGLFAAATQWHFMSHIDLEHLFFVQLLLVTGWGLGILSYRRSNELLEKHWLSPSMRPASEPKIGWAPTT